MAAVPAMTPKAEDARDDGDDEEGDGVA